VTPPLNVGPMTPPLDAQHMTPDELKNFKFDSPVAPPSGPGPSPRAFYGEDSPGYVPPSPEDFDSLDDIDDSVKFNPYTEQQRQMMYENETPEDSETPMDYERRPEGNEKILQTVSSLDKNDTAGLERLSNIEEDKEEEGETDSSDIKKI